jgi:hypothetical protein
MPFMEYLQSKLRRTIGVSEYNTGTDSRGLNPTATGVTALIDQANKKIRLLAQVMAHYFAEDYRYLIRLNQQFIDAPQVFRLLDRTIRIDPADLEGDFDLIVNVGVGSANKQAELQNTQLAIAVLEKVAREVPGMVTPDKAYNIVKLMLEQMGRKNVDDYINRPEFAARLKQIMAENQRLKAMLAAAQGGAIGGGNAGAAPAAPGGAGPTGPTGRGGAYLPGPAAAGPAAGMPPGY